MFDAHNSSYTHKCRLIKYLYGNVVHSQLIVVSDPFVIRKRYFAVWVDSRSWNVCRFDHSVGGMAPRVHLSRHPRGMARAPRPPTTTPNQWNLPERHMAWKMTSTTPQGHLEDPRGPRDRHTRPQTMPQGRYHVTTRDVNCPIEPSRRPQGTTQVIYRMATPKKIFSKIFTRYLQDILDIYQIFIDNP